MQHGNGSRGIPVGQDHWVVKEGSRLASSELSWVAYQMVFLDLTELKNKIWVIYHRRRVLCPLPHNSLTIYNAWLHMFHSVLTLSEKLATSGINMTRSYLTNVLYYKQHVRNMKIRSKIHTLLRHTWWQSPSFSLRAMFSTSNTVTWRHCKPVDSVRFKTADHSTWCPSRSQR
jgi:hypothetical protein